MTFSFKPDRTIMLGAAGLVLVGILAGIALTSVTLLERTRTAQSTVRGLQEMNSLQSTKIAQLSAQLAANTKQDTTDAAPARNVAPGGLQGAIAGALSSNEATAAALPAPVASVATPSVKPPTTEAVAPAKAEVAPAAPREVVALTPPVQQVVKKQVKPAPPKPAPAAQPKPQPSTTQELAAPAAAIVNARLSGGDKPAPPAAIPPATSVPSPMRVTLEQAGIAGMDTGSVSFKSGRQVAVGGEFPSGERLISVNPVDGKIVTDRRIILLSKPAVEK